jgi:hypothetical protein
MFLPRSGEPLRKFSKFPVLHEPAEGIVFTTEAENYLRKAFDHKANTLPGESMSAVANS